MKDHQPFIHQIAGLNLKLKELREEVSLDREALMFCDLTIERLDTDVRTLDGVPQMTIDRMTAARSLIQKRRARWRDA